ncbi:MAG: tyrosine-type recombinase/integrase, partial [Candidatus Krumholzibacteria bacterium]|nr:tyrosine-type recombinase/integrase [Candidatus Krumholzibacteria bacterium]
MGSLYQRGEMWWITYNHNGRRIRESAHTDLKSVADRLLKQREGQIAQGREPGVYFDKVRFNELATDFLNDYKVNARRSLKRAEQFVRVHLEPFFGKVRVARITTASIKEYISKRMDEGAKNATINRELAALKRMFHLADRCTPPKVDKIPYIPSLEENNKRSGFFEHEQFIALRDALPKYLKGFITFAYKTGCRLGEIQSLKWTGVNRQEGYIRLEGNQTKNKEART